MKTITMLTAMLLLSGCSMQAVSSQPTEKKTVDEMDLFVQTAVINFLDFRDGHLTPSGVQANPHWLKPASTVAMHSTPISITPLKGRQGTVTTPATVAKTAATAQPVAATSSQRMLTPPVLTRTPASKPTDTSRMLSPVPPQTGPKAVFSSPAPLKVWRMVPGTTLKDGLMVWASEATCINGATGHWTVQWETLVNYRIDAPLQFTGDFDSAINGLFMLYQHAQRPLYAGRVKAQCLLRVDDKEVK